MVGAGGLNVLKSDAAASWKPPATKIIKSVHLPAIGKLWKREAAATAGDFHPAGTSRGFIGILKDLRTRGSFHWVLLRFYYRHDFDTGVACLVAAFKRGLLVDHRGKEVAHERGW
jgi:hypothetical protein